MNKMNAAVVTTYGASEVIQVQSVEKPSPKSNEICINIMAAPASTADGMMHLACFHIRN